MCQTCPICLDEKEPRDMIGLETCCHSICSTCIVKTLRLKNNCPVCRKVWCPNMHESQPNTDMEPLSHQLQQAWLDSNQYNRNGLDERLYSQLTNLLIDNLINDFSNLEISERQTASNFVFALLTH